MHPTLKTPNVTCSPDSLLKPCACGRWWQPLAQAAMPLLPCSPPPSWPPLPWQWCWVQAARQQPPCLTLPPCCWLRLAWQCALMRQGCLARFPGEQPWQLQGLMLLTCSPCSRYSSQTPSRPCCHPDLWAPRFHPPRQLLSHPARPWLQPQQLPQPWKSRPSCPPSLCPACWCQLHPGYPCCPAPPPTASPQRPAGLPRQLRRPRALLAVLPRHQ
mmetsp:Transcript_36780/g.92903  ORF Transcript_36780/g.92903 Transcript_36780/m.92903 type:complete len:215 (-) Transcript_36780:1076-1720(-)